jgi:predicted metal-binding protein
MQPAAQAQGPLAILDGAALYGATSDGLIPWKQRPDALKRGVVSRVPPLHPASETQS